MGRDRDRLHDGWTVDGHPTTVHGRPRLRDELAHCGTEQTWRRGVPPPGEAPLAGSNVSIHIGITGHRNLTPATVDLIEEALSRLVSEQTAAQVVGITCLAEGADRLFANAVLSHGGTIEAIIPCHGYRERMTEDAQLQYDCLLARASRVTQLPYPEPKGAAYLAASLVLVERSDRLVAVLDESSPPSFAGTADVVAYARQVAVPVTIVWPPGSQRG